MYGVKVSFGFDTHHQKNDMIQYQKDMPVYFDVGANDGQSLYHVTSDPQNVVYAFEPTRELVKALRTLEKENYHVVDKAVSNVTGKRWFNVAGQADWGCSSLCDFNDNLQVTWPGRTDFVVTDGYEVDVIRLDDFVTEHNIEEIEYLHCDVQGLDLQVLMGLGDKIRIVKSGVIEMPTSHEKKLYKNQEYTVQDAVNFLESHSFEITHIQPNDHFNNEANVHFKRIDRV